MKTSNLMILALLAMMSMACNPGAEAETSPDSEFGLETLDAKNDSGVVQAGSSDATAILEFSNQPLENDAEGAEFLELLDSQLYARAAKNIAKFRAGTDAKFGTNDDKTFDDLEALDAVPYVGSAALDELLGLAKANGYPLAQGVRGDLQAKFSQHTYLAYRPAREHMFSTIDNRDGWVEGVYTGLMVETAGIPDHIIMNCEHTWPRSELFGAAETDLHHLFPTSSVANSKRSSFPFGMVASTTWEDGGSKLGLDADGNTVFEVRPSNRGNTARAKFYVSVMYSLEIPDTEEATLRAWSQEDPVDATEQARNTAVEAVQGNRNPFIDDPSLIAQIADF